MCGVLVYCKAVICGCDGFICRTRWWSVKFVTKTFLHGFTSPTSDDTSRKIASRTRLRQQRRPMWRWTARLFEGHEPRHRSLYNASCTVYMCVLAFLVRSLDVYVAQSDWWWIGWLNGSWECLGVCECMIVMEFTSQKHRFTCGLNLFWVCQNLQVYLGRGPAFVRNSGFQCLSCTNRVCLYWFGGSVRTCELILSECTVNCVFIESLFRARRLLQYLISNEVPPLNHRSQPLNLKPVGSLVLSVSRHTFQHLGLVSGKAWKISVLVLFPTEG